jgi:hypothetical protein
MEIVSYIFTGADRLVSYFGLKEYLRHVAGLGDARRCLLAWELRHLISFGAQWAMQEAE